MRKRSGEFAGALALSLCVVSFACRSAEEREPSAAPSAPSAPSDSRASAAPANPARVAEKARPLQPGLWARFYLVDQPLEKLPILVVNQTPNVSVVVPTLDIESDKNDASATTADLRYTFLSRVEGVLRIEEPGEYVLRLTSDDGSRLWIDGEPLIDHDGLHSAVEQDAALELDRGDHALFVEHFQTYGGFVLRLEWKRPGANAFEVVPSSVLATPAGEMLITSPGPKKVILPLLKGAPGDGLPLVAVHPSFDLATVRPEGFEPRVGGMGWLSDGRLAISLWDANGSVYLLDGVQSGDPAKVTAKLYASGLAEPLGLAVVDDRIFVLQKQELTELVDHDRDGVAEDYTALCSGWDVSPNFHEFAFGLAYKDGYFYANLAIAIEPGGKSSHPQIAGRGSTLKIALADGEFDVVAHGERTPNGIGLGVDGEIFLTDNQGDWLPSSKLMHLRTGAFYGSRAVLGKQAAELEVMPPVLWLPQGEIGNSPSQPALIPEGNGPYTGHMCHGDVTYGGVQRDFVEKIDGQYQGCVFPFTQGLEAGINRLTFGPDGALYVGGIGSTGNWGQEKKKRFGLQRLKYNSQPTFEMLAVREIEFTEPIAKSAGWEIENYLVRDWRYVPTEEYGGPKVDERTLAVRSASVSEDRRRVFLEIDGLEADRVVHVRIVGPVTAESGRTLWTTETWYTLNRIPKDHSGVVRSAPPPAPQNVLTDEERAAGWRLLFDGRTTSNWRGFNSKATPEGWRVEAGELVRAADAGDLITVDEFQDFELTLDWKLEAGGNSGVFFHVAEGQDAVWRTGPEMQILDNDRHADGKNPMTSAGSNYALNAPRSDVTRPIGLFNRARLVVAGSHVEHWLNGTKLFEYEMWTPEWEALVAASKFASMPRYGREKTGHIALQDHGDRVSFRNIKIRPLGASNGSRGG
jgi:cytochrome c